MPTRRLDTYFYHYDLDVEKMKEAASYLVGESCTTMPSGSRWLTA